MKSTVTFARCVHCGAIYNIDEVHYTCLRCGDDGILNIEFDYDRVKYEMTKESLAQNRDLSIWRYLPLLPVTKREFAPKLQLGWTPLYKTEVLGKEIGLNNLWIKDDSRLPTASLKDRASAIAIVRAGELGQNTICAASTGNAASSLAGLGASVGIHPIIFVPKTAPKAKIAQLQVFGAKVFMVNGTYDDAFDLSLEARAKFGWYSRSTAVNPVLSEGKKTVSLEICEQMQWDAPDVIAVSAGDGCIIGGVCKGLLELYGMGYINKLPRVIGCQAVGSSVLATAYKNHTEYIKVASAHTVADSISVDKPRDAIKALRFVRRTDGDYVTVEDQEILEAITLLGRHSGIFAEPAGATSLAGIRKARAQGMIGADEKVVAIVTGSGLKDVESAIKATGEPVAIDPNLASLEKALSSVLEK